MNNDWKYFITVYDGDFCEIEGVTVWDYKWKSNYEIVIVKDPIYKKIKSFHKYWIELPSKNIEFVAGEFSNCVWGFYIKKSFRKLR